MPIQAIRELIETRWLDDRLCMVTAPELLEELAMRPHLKPSVSTLYFRDFSPHQAIPLLAKHGWRCVELSECHAYDLAAEGNSAQVGQSFARYAADHGISLPQGHLPVAWYVDDDRRKGRAAYFDTAPPDAAAYGRALELVARWLDLFQGLGVAVAVLHLGGFALHEAGWSPAAIFRRRAEALAGIAALAAERGIVLCVENMDYPHCGTHTMPEIEALLAAAGGEGLGICLDCGHALLAGNDCAASVLQAAGRIRALHVNENGGTRDEHLLPYDAGTIPWERVLAALGSTGYDGPLNLEIVGSLAPPLAVREARLDYARALACFMVEQVRAARQGPDLAPAGQ